MPCAAGGSRGAGQCALQRERWHTTGHIMHQQCAQECACIVPVKQLVLPEKQHNRPSNDPATSALVGTCAGRHTTIGDPTPRPEPMSRTVGLIDHATEVVRAHAANVSAGGSMKLGHDHRNVDLVGMKLCMQEQRHARGACTTAIRLLRGCTTGSDT